MATTRNARSEKKKDKGFGLLAIGACTPWEITIDEHLADPDRFSAQLEGPSVQFSFEIRSLGIISKMIQFMDQKEHSNRKNGPLIIGTNQEMPITLLRDDEYRDRFFLLVGLPTNPVVRFVIAGDDVKKIVHALQQVHEDLE